MRYYFWLWSSVALLVLYAWAAYRIMRRLLGHRRAGMFGEEETMNIRMPIALYSAVISVAALISGCATQQLLTEEEFAALQPIHCPGKDQCDVIWQRAQLWIAKNSKYRIELANDVVIQTYGPFEADTDLAFRAYREQLPDGTANISFKALCGNWIGCERPPVGAIRDLKEFALAGVTTVAGQAGVAEKPKFGVTIAPLTRTVASFAGLQPGDGAVVVAVHQDSPAAKAGIRVGDIIRKFGDAAVTSAEDVRSAVVVVQPGQEVNVVIRRGKDDTTIKVQF